MKLLTIPELETLPDAIRLPEYDFRQTGTGIVHIGLGAFHRAHQALYTHEAMNAEAADVSRPGRWGIVAASLFSEKGVAADLPEQDGLYNVLEMDPDGKQTVKLCSSIRKTCVARRNRLPLIEVMASEDICIVSLTVTEKGYCLFPASGKLVEDHPLIIHDIANPLHPKSAPGLIVAALRLRRRRGIPPFAVLSCDNCPDNGARARSAVVQLAKMTDTELASWIEDNVSFPASMVDRIVPASTEEGSGALNQSLSVMDKCSVICEHFRQWVIEDDFPMGRPAWDRIDGVLMVKDVSPYESMKLRMLNGAHSLLAYLGYLGGYETIAEAMNNPDYEKIIRHFFMKEAIPSLTPLEGLSLEQYAQELIIRFKNSHIAHRTWQIAMDGSQKIPQRWLHTVTSLIGQGRDFTVIALGIAAWMRYVSGTDEKGSTIDVRDPLATELSRIGNGPGTLSDRVNAFLAVQDVFPPELANHEWFGNSVHEAFFRIEQQGVRKAVTTMVAELDS